MFEESVVDFFSICYPQMFLYEATGFLIAHSSQLPDVRDGEEKKGERGHLLN